MLLPHRIALGAGQQHRETGSKAHKSECPKVRKIVRQCIFVGEWVQDTEDNLKQDGFEIAKTECQLMLFVVAIEAIKYEALMKESSG